ncbi:hypothetical protein CsSME_00053980 [Camellia sinensis var. sinensis]
MIVRQCVSTSDPRTEHYKLFLDSQDSFDEYKELEFPIKSRRLHFFFAIGSVKGLFCLHEQDRYFLWNPSIRKSMAMSKPTVKTSMHYHGFGFVPRTNDYKLQPTTTTHIEVYSLNAGSWRMSSTGSNSYPDGITISYSGRFAAYLEGAVHFVATMKKTNDKLILSFDLRDEVFQMMLLPDRIVGPLTEVRTSVFGGLLSLLCYENTAANKSCSIWMMKEYGVVDSLCKQFTVDLSGGITELLGVRNNGHILLEANAPSDWVLSSYDPSSQQIKNLGVYATAYRFVVDTYEENLILLDKPNDAFSRRRVSRKTKDRFDQSSQARIDALVIDIRRQHRKYSLQFEEIKREIEVAIEAMARMGPQHNAEDFAKLFTFFLPLQLRDVSSNEQIDLMMLTATSQGSVVNDCDVAEKLSNSSVLGKGVGVKGKDSNGCTSSGQGKDLEADLIKMKAESAEGLKKLSQIKDMIMQIISKSLKPTDYSAGI